MAQTREEANARKRARYAENREKEMARMKAYQQFTADANRRKSNFHV